MRWSPHCPPQHGVSPDAATQHKRLGCTPYTQRAPHQGDDCWEALSSLGQGSRGPRIRMHPALSRLHPWGST